MLPGLATLSSYRRSWLRQDVVAGLVLTALLVPQGMAYAELAGLPPITGLYTSILCLVAYAVFGPSKILVLGPDSSLGPMIAATLIPIIGSHGDPRRERLRPRTAHRRRPRHRPRVAHRLHLDRVGVRSTHRRRGRRRPRDDRNRQRQHRGRLLPGLPGQHQRLAHGGGRAIGRQDP